MIFRKLALLAVFLTVFIQAQTYTIRTFAGGALPENIPGKSAIFRGSINHAVDKAGNVYIGLVDDAMVIRCDAATGMLTRIAGTGQIGAFSQTTIATERRLGSVTSLTFDSTGNLYFSEWTRLYKVASGILTVIAGNSGFTGADDGPAAQATFGGITGMAFDANGDLYLADRGNRRIRKISGGVVSTVAGTGGSGSSGDGGAPINAQLTPDAIAIDSAGTIYVADGDHDQVRKISGGIISTIAGTGVRGYSGDGTLATNAQLSMPVAVGVNATGEVFVAENLGHRIRKISSGTITTVAGNGTAGFSEDGSKSPDMLVNGPGSISIDAVGNILFTDINNRIRKIASGVLSTIAGGGSGGDGGPATSAQLNSVGGMSLDSSGNLFMADFQNGRVRKVSNGIISTVAGTGAIGFGGDGGPARDALLSVPLAPAFDSSGTLYFNDGRPRIRKVVNGVIQTIAGTGEEGYSGDGGAAAQARISATFVAVSPSNEVFLTDLHVRHNFNSGGHGYAWIQRRWRTSSECAV
jgi:hypothetical protein